MSSVRHLDAVHTRASLDQLDPSAYLAALADELRALAPATPEALIARDDALRAALAAIDALAGRALRLRLDHALAADLAADRALAAPFRKVLAATITGYADRLDLLAERVQATAARADPGAALAAVRIAVDAARAVLATRAELREGVLALAASLAADALPGARRAATDRHAEPAARQRWSALRRDLEAVAAAPAHLTTAPLATRLAALPALLDEAPEAPEPTRGELIELD